MINLKVQYVILTASNAVQILNIGESCFPLLLLDSNVGCQIENMQQGQMLLTMEGHKPYIVS